MTPREQAIAIWDQVLAENPSSIPLVFDAAQSERFYNLLTAFRQKVLQTQ